MLALGTARRPDRPSSACSSILAQSPGDGHPAFPRKARFSSGLLVSQGLGWSPVDCRICRSEIELSPAYPSLGITPPPPNYLLESSTSTPPASSDAVQRRWQRRFGVTHGVWSEGDDIRGDRGCGSHGRPGSRAALLGSCPGTTRRPLDYRSRSQRLFPRPG